MCIRDRILLNAFDITLTLPGIAGIILGIGMAVDANVIIFARVKEELTAGKSVHASLKSGFQKAMSAIVDGNITTLIAAGVLWLRGSGTVKGFAQKMCIRDRYRTGSSDTDTHCNRQCGSKCNRARD